MTPATGGDLVGKLANIGIPIVLGIIATYYELADSAALTQRELVLVNAIQFIATMWFTWTVANISAEQSFQQTQKKFALSAFRRIKEIESSVERLLKRVDLKARGKRRTTTIELEPLKEIAFSLRATVQSSKSDWADVIGEEIKALEKIEQSGRSGEVQSPAVLGKLEQLAHTLPSSLEIYAMEKAAERMDSAVDSFEEELREEGAIFLQGFWDRSFEIDIVSVPLGAMLDLSMDDVGDRIGALVAHYQGKTVGVVTNPTEVNYHEFTEALARAIRRSKCQAKYIEEGEKTHGSDERHYFTISIESMREIDTTEA